MNVFDVNQETRTRMIKVKKKIIPVNTMVSIGKRKLINVCLNLHSHIEVVKCLKSYRSEFHNRRRNDAFCLDT